MRCLDEVLESLDDMDAIGNQMDVVKLRNKEAQLHLNALQLHLKEAQLHLNASQLQIK